MDRIRRVALVLALALQAGPPLRAQDGFARLDASGSAITWGSEGVTVELALSRAVPWRVAMPDPWHLALGLQEMNWEDADLTMLLRGGARVEEAADGWSQVVIDLPAPFAVGEAGMTGGHEGDVTLSLHLNPTEATPPAAPRTAAREPLVVAIDPGHGGRDPGAEREGLRESGLMLALALELAQAVERAGMVPVLTREEDVFVPLSRRTTAARAASADVLVSLHADALEEGAATGASAYSLSQDAEDGVSERAVERHARGDLLHGFDLAGTDDPVATALMDLARQDTGPASRRLADAVVAGLARAGAPVNSRPHREAPLAVLAAADFPSVLVEVGFLSNPEDRARLSSPEGRAPIVAGLLLALASWSADERARAGLRLR